jgi:sugar lactone lactonase YvrE
VARGRVFHDGTLSRPQLDHPECVAVAPDGAVWCGGEHGQIYRISPDGAELRQVASTDGFVLGVAFAPDGRRLYACDLAHRAVFTVDTESGAVEKFTDGGDRPFVTPNFPAVAPDGTVYVSDSNAQGEPGGGVYRFAPDGTGGLWCAAALNFANGLALAADAVYVVESFLPGISRIPFATGVPEPVVTLPGTVPDGIAFGPDGRLYVGCYEPSQVLRVEADGTVTTVLADPTAHLLCHPTNLAFRGDELFTSNLGRWHVTVIDGLSDP